MTSNTFRLNLIRAGFMALALCLILAKLLPLQTLPHHWTGPDLLFAFALAWSVRRPDFVPLSILALVFVLSDFLLQRPPGLAAALMLLACADMQNRTKSLRDAGFATEWARASGLIVGAALAQHLVLLVLLANPPAFGLVVLQTVLTALVYPLCIAVTAGVFGVRMSAPGDLDGLGGRS